MRIKLGWHQQRGYFQRIKASTRLNWPQIAKRLKVNKNSLKDWRLGRYTIPSDVCNKIDRQFKVALPSGYKRLTLYWHIRDAARKGGIRRYLLYGSPGTPEGRRLGGLNSIKTHRKNLTAFQLPKPVRIPKISPPLAELFGIMIGDGGITELQVKVTLNYYDDRDYLPYVYSLFRELFQIEPGVYNSSERSTSEIALSRKNLVGYFVRKGLPKGNKIFQEIDIPGWIKSNREFSKACVRGIFDTDGCVYFDSHKIKERNYKSINLAITSASGKLLFSIYEILAKEGFTPAISSPRSIRIRKSEQVRQFFDKIGSRNPKHIKKFQGFFKMEGYPSGRTGAVSKTAWA